MEGSVAGSEQLFILRILIDRIFAGDEYSRADDSENIFLPKGQLQVLHFGPLAPHWNTNMVTWLFFL